MINIIFFQMDIQLLRHNLFQKITISPLNFMAFVVVQLITYICTFISTLFILFIYLSILVPVLHYLNYCSFIVNLEIM